MLASVTAGASVSVLMTWPRRTARWEGVLLSGGRAASKAACVAGVGSVVVDEKRPRERVGQVVKR